MSLRKSFSETSAPRPAFTCHTLLAHCSNSTSWVTPRSRVIASNSVRPGDLRLLLSSPPSRCLTTSVVRFSGLTLLTPATYRPSHFTRNLKFLYGSRRAALTVNWATVSSSDLELAGELLDMDQDELGGFERSEADQDVHDSPVDVVLGVVVLVALDQVCLLGTSSLEHALAEQRVHERAHVEPDGGPQRLVVRLEHHPLGTAVQTLLDEQRCPADRQVLPLVGQQVGTAQRPGTPHDRADHGECTQAVHAERVEAPVL